MKLLRTVALFAICLTALLSAAGCSEKGTESFNAVITEITEDGITARPFEDEEILKKASVIRLDQSVLSANPVPDFLPGDTARIVWNGKVKKGEPASLEHVFAVYSLPPCTVKNCSMPEMNISATPPQTDGFWAFWPSIST